MKQKIRINVTSEKNRARFAALCWASGATVFIIRRHMPPISAEMPAPKLIAGENLSGNELASLIIPEKNNIKNQRFKNCSLIFYPIIDK